MTMLTIENVSKGYIDKPLFKDISLSIKENDKLGLIGPNGSGKSTLVGIISGTVVPDTGKRTVGKEIKVHYLQQDPEFDQEGTIIREVFRGEEDVLKALYTYQQLLEQLDLEPSNQSVINEISRMNIKLDNLKAWDIESSAKSILSQLGLENLSVRVSQLSGGERKRVALARALITPCDLLILDEPTNHLDTGSITYLEDFLIKRKGALLLITHDRYFLDRVVNQIIEIDRTSLYTYKGNYSQFLELKAMREEDIAGSERKHRSLLRKELAWIRQGAKARSTKQKFRKERYEELKEKELTKAKSTLEIDIASQRLGRKVIEFDNVSKSFDGRKLIRDFTYTVVPGDRIGIIGKNGTGKSTLLNMITGHAVPDSGEVVIGETVKIGYYDQESTVLDDELRVIEYIKNIRMNITTQSGETISAGQMLEKFLFPSHLQWTYIKRLSGGEKRRLYLLGILMEEPNVLLLDEPTNDLDIDTLTILEDFLEDFGGAVIIVSHDRYFLDKCADHLFCFEDGGVIKRYVGSFSEYIEEHPHQIIKGKVKEPQRAPQQQKEKVKAKFSYKEQKEYDEIQGIMEDLESQIEHTQAEISQCGSDYVKLQELQEKIDELQTQLDQKMERWMELEEMNEMFKDLKS